MVQVAIWMWILLKYLFKKSLFIFQLIGDCHCWWTSGSPRAHVAKFYGQLRLIRSVFGASKFSVLKLIEIIISWVYYTITNGFSLFLALLDHDFQLLNYFVWTRITNRGSLPEMRIWSILFIKSYIFSYWISNAPRRSQNRYFMQGLRKNRHWTDTIAYSLLTLFRNHISIF